MTTDQNAAAAGEIEPQSADPRTDYGSGPLAGDEGDLHDAFRLDHSAGLGGHTLLSRTPAPQGRRSLFRR